MQERLWARGRNAMRAPRAGPILLSTLHGIVFVILGPAGRRGAASRTPVFGALRFLGPGGRRGLPPPHLCFGLFVFGGNQNNKPPFFCWGGFKGGGVFFFIVL